MSGNGTEGDPVLAEAQDGFDYRLSGQRHAAQSDPLPQQCQLRHRRRWLNSQDADVHVGTAQPSYRDGSIDGDVIAHEYGHGVSNRLVPGTLSGATNQCGSLGEGWSDTISFLRWGDATVGEYVTGERNGGIRTSSYDVHPDTYGDYSTAVTSPHRNGEIWAATMYGIRTTARDQPDDAPRSRRNAEHWQWPVADVPRRPRRHPVNDQAERRRNRCALWAAFAAAAWVRPQSRTVSTPSQREDFTAPADACPPPAPVARTPRPRAPT